MRAKQLLWGAGLLAGAGMLLAACATPLAPAEPAGDSVKKELVLTHQHHAEETYAAIMRTFYIAERNLYREHVEAKPDDRQFSYLWPYSGMVSAVNALARMPHAGAKYHDDLGRVLDGLESYWDGEGQPPAYDSYVRAAGGGQKFYDDNEWLGLDFVDAYRTLGDPAYLEQAKAMFAFAASGWSEDLGGGIYWRENDLETKNTCSNGPAAVLALELYQETGDRSYLDWASKILVWTRQLKSPDSGVYWDHLMRDGTLDKRTFTYNVGTVMHANALLYEITGEQSYLDEARALAKASLAHFAAPVEGAGVAVFPDTPWFNVVLLRGYIALYHADPARDSTYVDAMRANALYAWENARAENGLFSADWSGRSGMSTDTRWLLDQAPMVELYARLAAFDASASAANERRASFAQTTLIP